ncbi:GntR family transcriptional regulator [Spelaeicoccus albus]|uniref:DNA-binding GntR family transcriptional regulator n=1 Tax=Spelaeicoccus albus TaxID=1280376 RepID=A0A7Z0A8U4_9MICO|nr:GntR family transcriptional regulator [Spelaeicoccus albus]NYI66509.1 DNA-binding GntR family transcriptional regulator [Spelaeicoccus albus]
MTVAPAPSKAERAYQVIRSRIADGTYTPGYRLTLSRLASELGVSAVPIREAIRRLEAESLVEFERNVGATVAGINEQEYEWTMQTLGLVEGAATAMAMPFVDAAAIDEARAINEQMRGIVEAFDPQRFTRLNTELHRLLYRDCPNEHLLDLVERGWSRLSLMRSSIFSFVPERARESVDEHEHILQLISSGAAPDEVEHAVRAHRGATLQAFLERGAK